MLRIALGIMLIGLGFRLIADLLWVEVKTTAVPDSMDKFASGIKSVGDLTTT